MDPLSHTLACQRGHLVVARRCHKRTSVWTRTRCRPAMPTSWCHCHCRLGRTARVTVGCSFASLPPCPITLCRRRNSGQCAVHRDRVAIGRSSRPSTHCRTAFHRRAHQAPRHISLGRPRLPSIADCVESASRRTSHIMDTLTFYSTCRHPLPTVHCRSCHHPSRVLPRLRQSAPPRFADVSPRPRPLLAPRHHPSRVAAPKSLLVANHTGDASSRCPSCCAGCSTPTRSKRGR